MMAAVKAQSPRRAGSKESAILTQGLARRDECWPPCQHQQFYQFPRLWRSRGDFQALRGKGATIGTYEATTGGGACTYQSRNDPIPPSIYRTSNHGRNRTTAGMVVHDVGYSFDLDPADGTEILG